MTLTSCFSTSHIGSPDAVVSLLQAVLEGQGPIKMALYLLPVSPGHQETLLPHWFIK